MSDWIEINLPWEDYNIHDRKHGDSFCWRNLNKPGTLIETNDGIFLIGHINESAGIRDDCRQFDNDEIIKRYKVIWDEEDE